MTVALDKPPCELCTPTDVVVQNALAYVRYDNNSLSRGHMLAIPRRHVPSFFDMSKDEQLAILELLGEAQHQLERNLSPDGYNIGVNIGAAGGQSRMHVHVHLIPRYAGDVPNPSGGIRCVLSSAQRGA
jgi:diadenosine tetraphosphate (Ap4A) HIT family hydrolase